MACDHVVMAEARQYTAAPHSDGDQRLGGVDVQ
jgi:hypothetical protein